MTAPTAPTAPHTPRPHRPSGAAAAPALLVVAHGSRDPRHGATVTALVERVRALRPGLRVDPCFLDFTLPTPRQALTALARDGVSDVVAVPLLLTSAYHARADLPAVLAAETARLPGLTVRQADVLGPDPLLAAALTRRLSAAGVPAEERATTGVVLAAAGSSDPEAIAVIAATAREWRRTHRWYAVRPAFASAASPTTADAVRSLRADGVRRVAVAPYLIAPGRLPDRIARAAAEAGADRVAAVLGDAPELAQLVLRRYAAAAVAHATGRRAG